MSLKEVKFGGNSFKSLCFLVTIIMSWTVNKSILWAIFHCLVYWVYVPYWLIVYTRLTDYIREAFVR